MVGGRDQGRGSTLRWTNKAVQQGKSGIERRASRHCKSAGSHANTASSTRRSPAAAHLPGVRRPAPAAAPRATAAARPSTAAAAAWPPARLSCGSRALVTERRWPRTAPPAADGHAPWVPQGARSGGGLSRRGTAGGARQAGSVGCDHQLGRSDRKRGGRRRRGTGWWSGALAHARTAYACSVGRTCNTLRVPSPWHDTDTKHQHTQIVHRLLLLLPPASHASPTPSCTLPDSSPLCRHRLRRCAQPPLSSLCAPPAPKAR